jgi:hypothetical protein
MRTLDEKEVVKPFKKKGAKITIDESLDKYDNMIGNTEKLERANEILRKTGHPENYLKKE